MEAFERRYKCALCARAFPTKAAFFVHFRKHTVGKRLFACKICSATFKTPQMRNCHRMKHIPRKRTPPYVVFQVTGCDHNELLAAIDNVRNMMIEERINRMYRQARLEDVQIVEVAYTAQEFAQANFVSFDDIDRMALHNDRALEEMNRVAMQNARDYQQINKAAMQKAHAYQEINKVVVQNDDADEETNRAAVPSKEENN